MSKGNFGNIRVIHLATRNEWPFPSPDSYALLYFLPREATRIAMACCPSVCLYVCPSVTLRYCDHIRSNSAKIISRLLSLTISLSADPNITDLLQREHPQILAGIGVG